jgi:hypothetical protein
MDDDDGWVRPHPPPLAAESEAAWWRGWRGALLVGGGALLVVLLVGLALGEVELADAQGAEADEVDVIPAGQDGTSSE